MMLIARADRLKEAKAEAEQIVNAYRAEMEATYKEAQLKVSGKTGQAGNELQASTSSDINQMQ